MTTELESLTSVLLFLYSLIVIIGFLFLFAIMDKLQRIADRYRLKYGFDREIEKKEISKADYEFKLDKREQRFKRRVFKD